MSAEVQEIQDVQQIRSYTEAEKFLYGGDGPTKVCRTFDGCCQDPGSIVVLSWKEMATIAGYGVYHFATRVSDDDIAKHPWISEIENSDMLWRLVHPCPCVIGEKVKLCLLPKDELPYLCVQRPHLPQCQGLDHKSIVMLEGFLALQVGFSYWRKPIPSAWQGKDQQ